MKIKIGVEPAWVVDKALLFVGFLVIFLLYAEEVKSTYDDLNPLETVSL